MFKVGDRVITPLAGNKKGVVTYVNLYDDYPIHVKMTDKNDFCFDSVYGFRIESLILDFSYMQQIEAKKLLGLKE